MSSIVLQVYRRFGRNILSQPSHTFSPTVLHFYTSEMFHSRGSRGSSVEFEPSCWLSERPRLSRLRRPQTALTGWSSSRSSRGRFVARQEVACEVPLNPLKQHRHCMLRAALTLRSHAFSRTLLRVSRFSIKSDDFPNINCQLFVLETQFVVCQVKYI